MDDGIVPLVVKNEMIKDEPMEETKEDHPPKTKPKANVSVTPEDAIRNVIERASRQALPPLVTEAQLPQLVVAK